MRRKPTAVYGAVALEPKPTWLGVWLMFRYFAAPLLAALLAFDVLVWAIGRWAFDVCAAIWCVF